MSTASVNRRDNHGKHKGPNRKKSSHEELEMTETDESAVSNEAAGDGEPGTSNEPAAKLFAFTIDAKTAQIVKFESLDASGVRHELSDEEKMSLAREDSGEQLEEIVEQAFEAGIACVLGEGDKGLAKESEEDAELRHLLLTPLMEHSMAKRLLQGEVLNRVILDTLIQHSMKSGAESAGGSPAAGLQ
jgi:hypothetical protein